MMLLVVDDEHTEGGWSPPESVPVAAFWLWNRLHPRNEVETRGGDAVPPSGRAT
jgi:hypothetical protein